MNKPKYHLFKNASYAIDGLFNTFKHETSFKIEIILFILFSIIFWSLPLTLLAKFILQGSLFIPLIVELLNSAVEGVVDLVTDKHHELAKYAKDAGAAAVFLSLLLTVTIWIAVFIWQFL